MNTNKTMRQRAMALAAAALAAATGFGAMECRFLHEMTGEVVTPHYDFRGSASEKPLKVLFILNREGARDAVEVVQRFNVEPTYFLTGGGDGKIAEESSFEAAWKGTSVHEKTLELDRKLNARYDLYVLGNKLFTSIGEEHRYRILKAVRDDGAGLLIARSGYTLKMPYEAVYDEKLPDPSFVAPYPNDEDKMKMKFESWRVGKGRFVELAWNTKWPVSGKFNALTAGFPIDDLWFARYESSVAFVGQVMRYAAGRDAEPSEPVRVRLRDRFNHEVADASCAGVHYRDVIGANGSVRVEKVETPSPVGSLSLAAPETLRPGEALVAEATWQTPDERVKAAVFETVESPSWRVMTRVRMDVPAGATNLVCRIPDAKVETKAGYARVTLVGADGRPLDVAESLVLVLRRIRDDFVQMSWDSVLSMPAFSGARVIVDRLGFRYALTGGAPDGHNAVEMAIMNQSLVDYTTRVGYVPAENGSSKWGHWGWVPKEKSDPIKGDLCFYRPEVQQVWRDMVRERVQNLTKSSPAIYSLGDECYVDLKAGFGEYDDRFFRDFLKAKYGKIENLNRDWRTNCADFASVPHLKLDEAKSLGNLAAWGDHRAYMNKMYADTFNLCRDEIRKVDPGAPVGAEGSVSGDLEQTIEQLEFWGPYSDGVDDEALRSFGGDRIRTLWWGGYVGSHGGRGRFPMPLMTALAKGTVNGSAWFAINVGCSEGMLYSDLKIADDVAAYLDWHDRFRDGLAQLLIRNPLRDDGTLLYWSHPSKEASVASEEFLSPRDGLATLIGLCNRNGRSFEFVSSRTLGRLEKAKALFLCGATALSDAECAAIRAFAKRGGTVVADVEPAVLNQNLARREKPALADLWGHRKCVLLGKKLSFAMAKEKKRGDFDREMLAYFPPVREGAPLAPLDANAIVRTRKGPGFDLLTAVYPVSALGAKAKVAWPGRHYLYSPYEGYVGEAKDEFELDFTEVPFVCRSVFAERQSAPELSASDASLGGEVKFGLPKLVSGRVYSLIVRDPEGEVRGRAVFDREEKAMRSLDVAWNDRPGKWKATLTDCATGLKTEKTFKVCER